MNKVTKLWDKFANVANRSVDKKNVGDRDYKTFIRFSKEHDIQYRYISKYDDYVVKTNKMEYWQPLTLPPNEQFIPSMVIQIGENYITKDGKPIIYSKDEILDYIKVYCHRENQ